MRIWILLLAVLPAWPQGCDPNPTTRKVVEQLEVPDDLRLPAAERQNQKIAVLRRALTTSPRDVSFCTKRTRASESPGWKSIANP